MDIREYQESDLHKLLEYWRRIGANIPYFFPVSTERWQACLLEDKLNGETLFKDLETFFVTENDQTLGFVQYGQPSFAWDASGEKFYNPRIGVIRHFYFEEGRADVGEVLLAKANAYLKRFKKGHAFYHILGMSCNAHHGKLHSSLRHIDELMQTHSFQIEQENVYYSLDMEDAQLPDNVELKLIAKRIQHTNVQDFGVQLEDRTVCTAQVRFLEELTGGCTDDTVYLTWIGVNKPYRGLGLGTKSLQLLARYLQCKGYRYLHTDTANSNNTAQRFYERFGFQNQGITRSYLRT